MQNEFHTIEEGLDGRFGIRFHERAQRVIVATLGALFVAVLFTSCTRHKKSCSAYDGVRIEQVQPAVVQH
jgi:hypothetical protein